MSDQTVMFKHNHVWVLSLQTCCVFTFNVAREKAFRLLGRASRLTKEFGKCRAKLDKEFGWRCWSVNFAKSN